MLIIYDHGEEIAVRVPDTDEPLWLLAERGEIKLEADYVNS